MKTFHSLLASTISQEKPACCTSLNERKGSLDSNFLQVTNKLAEKTAAVQTQTISYRKGRMIQKPEPKARRVVWRVTKNHFQGLQTSPLPAPSGRKQQHVPGWISELLWASRCYVWLWMTAVLSLPRRVSWVGKVNSKSNLTHEGSATREKQDPC